jgi:23S rRNA (uracil1939-C5)-methyltransferase
MSKELIELTIDDLAIDGKSVAHLNGKVVFLDTGLPGETVLAEITRARPKYFQARVQEITSRSSSRVETVCSHFDICGGCSWQDLEYEAQLELKRRHVVECLSRIGEIENPAVAQVLASKSVFRYRNKMKFSFHVLEDGGFTLGLHRQGRFDDIFDLDACYLQSEVANRIVHYVRGFVAEHKVPVYDVRNHTGYMRFLVIRETSITRQVMVNLVTNMGSFPAVDVLVAGLVAEFPEIVTVVHGQNGKKANIAVAEVETVLHGPGFIEEELLGRRFKIKANSFFQTNSIQAEKLYETAFSLLQAQPDDRVLDLYCGTGTIGLCLASGVKEVTGVELVPDAVQMATENAAANGIDNIRFFEGHVKDYLRQLPSEESPFDAVIVDPPRAGLNPKALKRVLALDVPRLLYISCNPATFARDAKSIREAGYEISEVHPVDMFPHTRHIELAALFSR